MGGQGFKVSELWTEKSILCCFSTVLHRCCKINWSQKNDRFSNFANTSKLNVLGRFLAQF